jgi:hypothetical protein
MFKNWIRDFNYIQDYFNTSYEYYSSVYSAYPVHYYSLDISNTVWESENLMAGSYEKGGVGELSGVQWKKILFLPVYGVETIQPTINNSEKGQTYHDSLSSNITFPEGYGLRPMEGDIIDLNIGLTETVPHDKPLFIVTSVNLAHPGTEKQLWQCRIKVVGFGSSQLDKQVNQYYMFIPSNNKIIRLDQANFISNVNSKITDVVNVLNQSFDNSGFYLL